jgi:hypothetical protein
MRTDSRSYRFVASSLVSLASFAVCAAQSNVPPSPAIDTAQSAHATSLRAVPPARAASIQESYGKLPMSFEANQGQTDRQVRFTARGSGYSLFLTGSSAVLTLTKPDSTTDVRAGVHNPNNAPREARKPTQTDVVRMELVRANPNAKVSGADQLPGTANYFTGSEPAKWHTGVPTYAKVRYASVYDGVDLVYYGNQRQLEYDFVIAPNADPKPIRLHFAGASKLSLATNGDLRVQAKNGQIAFHKPEIYQESNGQRHSVQGCFALLANNSVGFALGRYDRSQPLVIDPILVYSTYVGGISNSGIGGLAVDSAGNAYVAGTTGSSNYPVTSGAYQTTDNDLYGQPTAFVAKLNAKGTALVYSTYLGGTGQYFWGPFGTADVNDSCGATVLGIGYYGSCGDYAGPIAVDDSGNAYVAGSTFSTDFPVTPGAFQITNNGDTSNPNVFVTELNPTGTALVYSTYLGGSGGGDGGGDTASAIAVDSGGNAFVAGYAYSHDFPVTANSVQPQNNASVATNAFVTKLNSTGTALIYSTYLGGGGTTIPWYNPGETQPTGDGANGLAIDSAGEAFVAGISYGNFPVTPGAYLTISPPPQCDPDNGCTATSLPFVAKLNSKGTALVYATYLNNGGNAIAVDNAGSAYTADFSSVTKLTADGSGLVYFAPLTGPIGYSIAIAVDGSGNAYLTGSAGAGLPVTPNAFQPVLIGKSDAFLTELNAAGSAPVYSTYLGGSGGASASGLVLDTAGNVYLAGSAGVDFPVTPGALQTGISGTGDGFVAKLNLSSASTTTPTTTTLTGGINPQPFGMPDTFTATVTGNGGEPTGYVYFTVDGVYAARTTLSPSGTAVYKTSSLPLGTHNVEALYAGSPTFSVSNDTVTENVIATATPMISPSAGKYVGSVQVSLSDPTPGATIYYTINGGAPNVSSLVYSEPFTISSGYGVVRAYATLDGYSPTAVVEAAYSILPQTPAPMIAPVSGSVPVGQAVTITDADSAATIRYTTNGSTPSTTSTWYHGPLAVLGPETISSIATFTGQASSETAAAVYTVFTQAPTILPAPGKYVGPTAIMLSDVSPAPYATIHYTLDGSNPSATSPVYSGPVTISSGYVVVKAIATFSGYPPTAITEAAYTILAQNPTPMISPASGSYPVGQTITITDSDSAATIRYTTDGSTPTTKSPIYTKALVLTGAETVQAIATGTSNATSNVATAIYTTE